MKGSIPGNKIEEVKQRADIVELISEYVTLKKAGRNYVGLCPFHNEKTPSFTVNRDKQMFYCFGCGEGGQVFSFLMKASNMTFPEAVRYLAQKNGIVIPEISDRRETEQWGLREQIYRINEEAASFFTSALFSQKGSEARDYLKQRGIQEDVVRTFRLGYADQEWRTLGNFFVRKNIPLSQSAQAGLLTTREEGSGAGGQDFYDRFRGRLIFPIEDAGGQIMAFGGRVVGKGEPKYLNSPETPVFSKGRNLYGLSKATEGIRKKGYAILVEGYFDLISLWNAGIDNVLASLGTALTIEQVKLIRRYTGHVAVIFDGDEAGKKALMRSLPLFLSGGVQAKAVILPGNDDPDDYVRKYGRERLETIIEQAPSIADHYISSVFADKVALEERRDAIKEALTLVAGLEGAIEKDLFLRKIAEKTGIDPVLLRKELPRLRKGDSSPAPDQERKPPRKNLRELDRVEFNLILFIIQHPDSIGRVEEMKILDCFTDKELKGLGEKLMAINREQDREMPLSTRFIDILEEGPLRGLIIKSLMEGRTDDERVRERYFSDTVRQIRKKWRRRKKEALLLELSQVERMGNNQESERLLKEIKEIDELSREEMLN